MKYRQGLLMAAVLGLAALACATPALPMGSAPLPTSENLATPDTRLDRMVAETVTAALALTQDALPTLSLATATPQPTATLEPTATPTVNPTGDSVLDKNNDLSSTFIDLRGKYQMTVPMQWLALRANSPEYLDAVMLPEAEDPAIKRSLDAINQQDPNVFRLFLLDIAEEHVDGGFVTNVNLVWDQQMEVSLATADDVRGLAATLPASLPNAEVLSAEVKSTTNETPYGVITLTTTLTGAEGASILVYQKLVFLDLPVGTLTVTLSTTQTWQETVEPSFDMLIESILILE